MTKRRFAFGKDKKRLFFIEPTNENKFHCESLALPKLANLTPTRHF